MKQVNLSDFDFSQPTGIRSHNTRVAQGAVTMGIKGRARKNNNQNLLLTGFYRDTGVDFTKLTVGVNRYSNKDSKVIFLFDSKFPGAKIRKSATANVVYASGKGWVIKVLDAFNVQLPSAPGAAVRFHFNLEKVDEETNTYEVIPVRLDKVDAMGQVHTTDFPKSNGGNKTDRPETARRTAY